MKTVILGASNKADRFAYRAQALLQEHGHETFPVSLSGEEILERKGYRSILDIPEEDGPIDTVTVYVNARRFAEIADEVAEASPRRVIFNPGTESDEISQRFRDLGMEVMDACTLVLLETGRF